MATMQLINPQYVNNSLISGISPRIEGGPRISAFGTNVDLTAHTYLKETASQTYVVGDLVYLDSNGTVAIATKNGSSQSNAQILGLAHVKATGTTGAPTEVLVIRPSDIFLMNVYHSTWASAVTAQTQLANNSQVGYAVISTASGGTGSTGTSSKWCVDIENVSNLELSTNALARVRIIGFHEGPVQDSSGNTVTPTIGGDLFGLVYVQFLPVSINGAGNPSTKILQRY